MALSREAYQALEAIVGPKNISDDPTILDTYAFQNTAELRTSDSSKFMPRAEAILLPAITEEVQAILRVCNRYKIRCKAHSTGWGTWTVPQVPGILLDLRRMNRILEIDEKNMFAVVEPYVTAVVLQAEAMKVGLNAHMIGAGALSSVLAQATSMHGMGPDSISMGYAAQNLLALEWVSPTGDILRTGSLGSRSGWFCGEGPGPSVRGLFRGYMGAVGGLGVFTKCAVKLYPWPGPSVMDIKGTIPAYNWKLTENFRVYTLSFPTWPAVADAYYALYDSEIGYIVHRQFNLFGNDLAAGLVKIFSDSEKTIDDLPELLENSKVKKLTDEMRNSFQIILAGKTLRDIEYQEEVLKAILTQTKGHIVQELATPEMQNYVGLYLLRMCFKAYNWLLAGGYAGSFIPAGTPDYEVSKMENMIRIKNKHIARGGIVDDGGNSYMAAASLLGGGGIFDFELMTHFDPHVRESVAAMRAYMAENREENDRQRLGITVGTMLGFGLSKEEHDAALKLAHQPACWDWQRKIAHIFDPNGIGDGSYAYTSEAK